MRMGFGLASLVLLSVGMLRAEDLPPQVMFELRIVRVSSSMYERLLETVPLEAKKPVVFKDQDFRDLMETVQGDVATTIMAAPRMTTLSGQPGRVKIGNEYQAITGAKVSLKNGKLVSEPETSQIETGLEVRLTGTLRGDAIETDLAVVSTRLGKSNPKPIEIRSGSERLKQTIDQPEVLSNTLERRMTLTADRTVILPGWWEKDEFEVAAPPAPKKLFAVAAKESQRVLVCVTVRAVR